MFYLNDVDPKCVLVNDWSYSTISDASSISASETPKWQGSVAHAPVALFNLDMLVACIFHSVNVCTMMSISNAPRPPSSAFFEVKSFGLFRPSASAFGLFGLRPSSALVMSHPLPHPPPLQHKRVFDSESLDEEASTKTKTSNGEGGRDDRGVRPFIIGVTGGTACGKTTVCREIVARLGVPSVTILAMDRFYRSLEADEAPSRHNFDVPNAFDFELFEDAIRQLITSRNARVPTYSYVTHQRLADTDEIEHADVVIVEGILTLYHPQIRALLDMKIYVDTEDDVRLARRIKRDIAERGRSIDDVLHQYLVTVKPAFDEFIAPTKRWADIIIPRGGENLVAIDLLVHHIRRQLRKRGVHLDDYQFK